MSFLNYNIGDDVDTNPESDPIIKKMIKRTAGASVLQDIALGTYWANTAGKTKYPGVYHMYKKELKDNMIQLLSSRMTYRELEDFLVSVGYETGDIRCTFEKITCLDPVKLDHMKQEDVKNTPPNIPWFNLGWGASKKKGAESYFIMPLHSGLLSIYSQVNDMDRKEVGSFLRLDEALEALGGFVKQVHRYDMKVDEMIEQGEIEFDPIEPTNPMYIAVSDRFHELEKKGALALEYIYKTVRDTVTCGNLTEAEGQYLIKKYAADEKAPASAPDEAEVDEEKEEESSEEIKHHQKKKNVIHELSKRTPQDFFQASLPDRIEEIATEHIRNVLVYIANRASDMEAFDVALHSLQYMKHEQQKVVGPQSAETAQVSNAPKATISAILEIKNDDAPEDKNKKFALAVFFVNADGQVTTSDSVKGEDDIIYGFTEDGLTQYFSRSKERQEKE